MPLRHRCWALLKLATSISLLLCSSFMLKIVVSYLSMGDSLFVGGGFHNVEIPERIILKTYVIPWTSADGDVSFSN